MKTAKKSQRIKIDLPPEEALSRAMMVKPPKDWKKALAKQKKEKLRPFQD
jgi:hypothetical protein